MQKKQYACKFNFRTFSLTIAIYAHYISSSPMPSESKTCIRCEFSINAAEVTYRSYLSAYRLPFWVLHSFYNNRILCMKYIYNFSHTEFHSFDNIYFSSCDPMRKHLCVCVVVNEMFVLVSLCERTI